MTCRGCKYMFVAEGDRIYKNNMYRCTFVPEMPKLSEAITRAYGFSWPPKPTYIAPDDGASCPAFEAKAKKK